MTPSTLGSFVLYLSVFGSIPPAARGQVSPPGTTSDASEDLDGATANCVNDCEFAAIGARLQWKEVSAPTTIPLATVIEIVNTEEGTTRTTTIVNELPAGVTPPPTNEGGTHIETVTITREGRVTSTVVAFPTPYLWWDQGYTWDGTLLVGSVCETATSTGSTELFTTFPIATPTGTPTPANGNPDPEGLLFSLTTILLPVSNMTSYFSEPVVQSCTPEVHSGAGIEPALTVAFMGAITSTSFEGGKRGASAPSNTAGAGNSPTPEAHGSTTLPASQPSIVASGTDSSGSSTSGGSSTSLAYASGVWGLYYLLGLVVINL